jgi:2-hydroxychromene-2-carboxylate isomerase
MVVKGFEFLFDFAGPNGYLVHRVLPRFCAETGVTATYVPVLLGGLMKATNNRPHWAVYADVPAKLAYDRLEFNRFIATNGLNRFRMNPHFPSNSLKLMRACVAAARTGAMAEFVEAMMTAVWEEGLDMGDVDAVRARIDAAGLDGASLLALADDPDVNANWSPTRKALSRAARSASPRSSWVTRCSSARSVWCRWQPRWRSDPHPAALDPGRAQGLQKFSVMTPDRPATRR